MQCVNRLLHGIKQDSVGKHDGEIAFHRRIARQRLRLRDSPRLRIERLQEKFRKKGSPAEFPLFRFLRAKFPEAGRGLSVEDRPRRMTRSLITPPSVLDKLAFGIAE